MKIPLVDLQAQYRSIQAEIDEAIHRVVSRQGFILGEEVKSFEEEFAAYCGAPYAVGVASGTAALHLAMLACGVGPGDEVVTTPMTFIATVEPITQLGARAVFADIDPRTRNLDPNKIEAVLTEKTRAILPVHLHGQPVDIDPMLELGRRYNVEVIEDAAQAHGAEYRGRRAGTLAAAAGFSFYPGKNLGAYGDAGAVVTSRPEIAEKVRLLRDHGRRDKYEHLVEGYGERLDALQAAILSAKLKHLPDWTVARQQRAQRYNELLDEVGDLILPCAPTGIQSVYHVYAVQTSRRDELQRWLKEREIATGVHYPIPLHLQPALAYLGYHRGDLPVAERAAETMLSLPIYPEMTDEQQDRIVAAVREFFS